MIGLVASLLLRAKVSESASRVLAWVIVITGAVLLAWSAWGLLKRSIVTNHDNAQAATEARAQVKRQAEADDDQLDRAARHDEQATQLQGAIDNAVTVDPAGAGSAAGPGTNAALAELWRRQEARAQRRQPAGD